MRVPATPAVVVEGKLVTLSVAGLAASVYDWLPVVPLASVAVTVKVEEPAAVGVPLRTPPAESVSHAGSEPAVTAKVYGAVPPLAVRVWL